MKAVYCGAIQIGQTMKIVGLFVVLAVLAGCESTGSSRPAPEPEPTQSGITISGYGRIGVSTES